MNYRKIKNRRTLCGEIRYFNRHNQAQLAVTKQNGPSLPPQTTATPKTPKSPPYFHISYLFISLSRSAKHLTMDVAQEGLQKPVTVCNLLLQTAEHISKDCRICI